MRTDYSLAIDLNCCFFFTAIFFAPKRYKIYSHQHQTAFMNHTLNSDLSHIRMNGANDKTGKQEKFMSTERSNDDGGSINDSRIQSSAQVTEENLPDDPHLTCKLIYA